MLTSSEWFWGVEGSGEICCVLRVVSCGVQLAGENVNWEEGGDKSVSSDECSSESGIGEGLRVEGMKRNSSSLCLVAVGWRGVNLDQSGSSVN